MKIDKKNNSENENDFYLIVQLTIWILNLLILINMKLF